MFDINRNQQGNALVKIFLVLLFVSLFLLLTSSILIKANAKPTQCNPGDVNSECKVCTCSGGSCSYDQYECNSNQYCSNGVCVALCGSFNTLIHIDAFDYCLSKMLGLPVEVSPQAELLSELTGAFSGDCSTGHNDADTLPVSKRESAYFYADGTNIKAHCVDDGHSVACWSIPPWCFTCKESLNFYKPSIQVSSCTHNDETGENYDAECVFVKTCSPRPVVGTTIQKSSNLIGCDFKSIGTVCSKDDSLGACDGKGHCVITSTRCSQKGDSCGTQKCCPSLNCVDTKGNSVVTNGHCCSKGEYWNSSTHGCDKKIIPKNTCTDSDGGLNNFVAGYVSGVKNGINYKYYDKCFNSTHLTEYYCNDFSSDNPNTPAKKVIYCGKNYECKDSVCVIAPNSCHDNDGGLNVLVKGTVTTISNGYVHKYNDSCSDSSYVSEFYCSPDRENVDNENADIPCGSDYSCKNGACVSNKKTKNECVSFNFTTWDNQRQRLNHYHYVNTLQNGKSSIYKDHCIDNHHYIIYGCKNNLLTSSKYPCPEDSICKYKRIGKEPDDWCILSNTCYDSDFGKDYYTKGTVTGYEDGKYYSYTDYCTSKTLTEYYCDEVSHKNITHDCREGYTCKDGRCVQSQQNTCTDSDGGINLVVNGTINGTKDYTYYSLSDYCVNQDVLTEYYCDNTSPEVITYNCSVSKPVSKWFTTKCVDGKCVPVPKICPNGTSMCQGHWWPNNYGPWVNLPPDPFHSCDVFEVCRPGLIPFARDAIDCCYLKDRNPKNKFSLCSQAREKSGIPLEQVGTFNRSKAKACAAYYVIYGETGWADAFKGLEGYYYPETGLLALSNGYCACGDKMMIKPGNASGSTSPCEAGNDCSYDRGLSYPGFVGVKCQGAVSISPMGWQSDTDKSKDSCSFSYLPAHVDLNIVHTGTCVDYSIALTTLLRMVGYNSSEVYTAIGLINVFMGHGYNLVKFPGDKKYTIVDTTGNYENFNLPGDSNHTTKQPNTGYDYCRGICNVEHLLGFACANDEYVGSCPKMSQIYGCPSPLITWSPTIVWGCD